MITVVHIFHALPEKYASAFAAFATEELGAYRHEFIAMRQSGDDSHAYDGAVSFAPSGWIARYRFFQARARRREPAVWIFHGMFHGSETLSLWLALFALSDLKYRSVWVMWGGDLYEFQQPATSLVARLRRWLHRGVAARFNYIAALAPGDLDLAHVRLNSRALKLQSLYVNPLPFTSEAPAPRPSHVTVLLGNSADPTNEHLKALDDLARIDSGFDIVCPLSYSGSPAYVQQVTEKGTRLFGNRFRPLTSMMSPTAYAAEIAGVSVAIFCHNRQQALGNILSLLYDGKQVFMRADTTGFLYLADLGLAVQPLDALTAETLRFPVSPDHDAVDAQRKIIREHFGRPRAVELWTRLVDRIAAQAPKHD